MGAAAGAPDTTAGSGGEPDVTAINDAAINDAALNDAALNDAARQSVVETHASVLVFFDDVVLKYKKPLRLPFADFTDVAQRRRACESEVASNRRLSPDVYLGVADVRIRGELLDHAVVMRRLPEQRSLASMVASHDPSLTAHLPRLASLLAAFHVDAHRSEEIDASGDPAAVARTWRRCLDVLAAFDDALGETALLARIDELATRYLQGRGPLFDDRIARRRVCDAHGDLLASDVFLLDDGPRVLDCVEFDEELRHVDVVADIAFLVMDLEYRGAPEVASQFLREYRKVTGDQFPITLLHHYCAQRAVIRAEVASLRAAQRMGRAHHASAQEDRAQATKLLALARDHLDAGRVVLGVVSGFPGTGKSTLASAAGKALRWPVIRSDEVRQELVRGRGDTEPLVAAGAYTSAMTERTYRTLLERTGEALVRGQPVIVDATFTDPAFRRAAEALAETTTSDLVVVQCTVPPRVAAARARARHQEGIDVSEADEHIVRAMAAVTAPWEGAVVVDTARGAQDDQAARVIAALRGGTTDPTTGADGSPGWLGTLAPTFEAPLG